MSIPLIYREDAVGTFWIKRSERMYVPYNDPYADTYSYFGHLSKNIWNQAQYIVEKEYKEFGHIPCYEDVDKMLKDRSYYKDKDGKINLDFDNYHKLSVATAQQILMVHNEAWFDHKKGEKGYFDENNPKRDNYTGKPRKPKYKKKDGEFILIFTNQQCKIRNGYLIFPKKLMGYDFEKKKWLSFPKIKVRFDSRDNYGTGLVLKGDNDDTERINRRNENKIGCIKLDEVRIIPQGIGYMIEIVYDMELIRRDYSLNPNIIVGVDLGVDNLAAVTDNIGSQPIIIKGNEIKCINQWYNKKMAEFLSIYSRQPTMCILNKDHLVCKREYGRKENIGKALAIIARNRNFAIMNAFHELSSGLIRYALSIRAGVISIGRNPGWKQKVKMGKRNNQNFVNIPFAKLIKLLKYKAEEYGIIVKDPTEGYTSKCSFLDTEDICFHLKYMGERIYRGLFRSSKGILVKKYGIGKEILINEINADVNASYNMIRKVSPKFNVYDIMEGVENHRLVPVRLSISDLLTFGKKKSELIVKLNILR